MAQVIKIIDLLQKTYTSQSIKKTGLLARRIFKLVSKKNGPLIFGLVGDLGAAKTTFTQQFLRGLGVKGRIVSPTFVLVKKYPLRHKKYKNAYHLDLYRLIKPSEILKLGLKELMREKDAVVFIEWADRIKKLLPKNTVWVNFKHGKRENERTVILSGLR